MKFYIFLKVINIVFFICVFFYSYPQNSIITKNDSVWADSVLKTLTPYERITQLFMIRVLPNGNPKYFDEINKLICNYKVGGVAFFKGSPVIQAKWLNYWQQNASVPILTAIDGEWGISMRYDSSIVYPRQLTLGAINNDSLLYQIGRAIGNECRLLGIHINFAPVADVNSNPKNPVINSRSFGENKYEVAKRSEIYMTAMQNQGIIACAKHFPGHGDTDIDSHYALPLINHPLETIDTLDLYPFKKLIEKGINSIMVAHLKIPSLDTNKNSVSSLSYEIITNLLKGKLKFHGLVFSDALDMKGVSATNKPGESEIKALNAGIDILLLPEDFPKAVDSIKKAIDDNRVSQELINQKCFKILAFKHYAGLHKEKSIDTINLIKKLNNPKNIYLQQCLYENAITLVKNNENFLPLTCDTNKCVAIVSIGDTTFNTFQKMVSNYARVDLFNLPKKFSIRIADSLMQLLYNYDKVFIGIHNTNNMANLQFGVMQETVDFIDSISNYKNVCLNIFGSPYILDRFRNSAKMKAIVVSYQDNDITEAQSAQRLFGVESYKGKLPVSASATFPLNTGLQTRITGKIKYTLPEEVGISSNDLSKIDSIAQSGIINKAYPGCQVLFAKKGKVIFNKTYGYLTYENKNPLTDDMIYDLASITKIAATTLAVMKLYEEGKINIDTTLGFYLPQLTGSNKENLIIRDVLAHKARLKAWIPFYKKTIKDFKPDSNIYRNVSSDKFSFRVADSLYIRNDYRDTIISDIIQSPLNKKKGYVYSDLAFYLLKMIVEKISKQDIETYVDENFYKPLCLSTIGYKPLERLSRKRIVPTEIDTVFRKKLLHGDVNDQGAAMLGGVSGHAGLFSNANDLVVILQMLLQNGVYGGNKYLSESTIAEFTKYQFPEKHNRRGLGFDKLSLNPKENNIASKSASPESYGHSGFTGTFFWVDPKEELIFIFLSNRVYPNANNKKISELNIRTNIHQVIYDAIRK